MATLIPTGRLQVPAALIPQRQTFISVYHHNTRQQQPQDAPPRTSHIYLAFSSKKDIMASTNHKHFDNGQFGLGFSSCSATKQYLYRDAVLTEHGF